MAIAHSIFTLDGGFNGFSAFYVSVTVVPLKVAIGLVNIDFWALKNSKMYT